VGHRPESREPPTSAGEVDDAGVVLRTGSTEELTQAMERLLRFDDQRQRLGALGRQRSGAYNVGRLGRETAAVYGRALVA